MVNHSRSHNYEAISQVCQTDQELSFGQNISDGARLVQTLKKLMPLGGNFAFSCQLGSDKKDCSQILHPMVTGVGMCLTFNAFDEYEMYRKENIHSLYPYHTHKKWASDRWSTEIGYFMASMRTTFLFGSRAVAPVLPSASTSPCPNGISTTCVKAASRGSVSICTSQRMRLM